MKLTDKELRIAVSIIIDNLNSIADEIAELKKTIKESENVKNKSKV